MVLVDHWRRALQDGWNVTVMDLSQSLQRHPPEQGIKSIEIDLTNPTSISNAFSNLDKLSGFVILLAIYKV